MRLTAGLATAATAAALLVSGCGSTSGDGGAAATSGPIKIGAWFPLTGANAANGIPQHAGAAAYFDWLNAHGGINGRKVAYLARDNAYDPAQTIQVARSLIGNDKVVAIVGSNGTATSAAAFPYVLDQAKVPILLTYGGAATWYSPPKPMLYGFQTLYENTVAEASAWAAEDGAKNILVVRSDPDAFKIAAATAAPAAKAVDPSVNVSQLVVKFQTTDYSPIVAQVKAKKPDAVVSVLSFPELAAFMKQATLQGLAAKVYSYHGAADEGLLKLAGGAADGLHLLALTKLPDDSSPAMQQYRAAMAKYEPSVHPSLSSAAMFAAAKAFTQVVKGIKGPITPSTIAAAFAKARTVDTGILPPLQFSATKHLGTDQMQRLEVQGGKFVAVGDFRTPPSLKG
jgi:branched-chain amino acid transport system substrate-binding protein